MNRPRLPDDEIDRIRHDRNMPQPTHWHYLHLAGLLRGLTRTLERLSDAGGPVLDLYCGTQPYRDVIPWSPVWGYDIDLHFGHADVVGGTELPFRDMAFTLVICTQALYQVEDPAATVAETERVLMPGGHVLVTVPHVFRRELSHERKYGSHDLQRMFAGWSDVRIMGLGGIGTGLAYVLGCIASGVERRWPRVGLLRPAAAALLNGLGAFLDIVLWPLNRRWPAILVLVARRPSG